MEDDFVGCDPQVHQDEKRATPTGKKSERTGSAWMRRHLEASIYLWACGEKADEEDEDLKVSDRLIGWLILILQGFAYVMLIVLARHSSSSGTDDSDNDESGETRYLLASVAGAMYLLIASTTHDLRAGFSLLVDSMCADHRVFGLGLLILYGAMIYAAMTVLVSTSEDSASVVLNAVAVVFIADLDEKALRFLSTVPQKWRLFWAIYSIGISFALTLVAVIYVGDSSSLLKSINEKMPFLSWVTWLLNPGAVTICSYLLSTGLQNFSESFSEGSQSVDQLTLGFIVSKAFRGLWASIKGAKEGLRAQPCFYAAVGSWFLQGVASWNFLVLLRTELDIPFAFELNGGGIEFADMGVLFVFLHAVLATGLAMKALGVFIPRVTAIPEPCRSSPGTGCGSCADSRVPSLLVGWGIGYWVTSLLFLLSSSLHKGGWYDAPIAVAIVGYVVVPCFAIASTFMVADINILGSKFGAFIKPAVEIMRDRRRVVYWTLMTVYRDAFLIWVTFLVYLLAIV